MSRVESFQQIQRDISKCSDSESFPKASPLNWKYLVCMFQRYNIQIELRCNG